MTARSTKNTRRHSRAVAHVDPRFQEILDELQTADGATNAFREHFPGKMEQEYHDWYHRNTICKKIILRLDRQELVAAVVTTVEFIYLLNSRTIGKESRTPRVPLFLGCRFTCFFIIFFWRIYAKPT